MERGCLAWTPLATLPQAPPAPARWWVGDLRTVPRHTSLSLLKSALVVGAASYGLLTELVPSLLSDLSSPLSNLTQIIHPAIHYRTSILMFVQGTHHIAQAMVI